MKRKLDDYHIVLNVWEHYNLNEDLEKKSTLALIDLLDKAWVIGEDTFHHEDYEQVSRILSHRLDYALIGVIKEQLIEHINRLSDAIIELNNKFENHRHKKEPDYSEKPVWDKPI